MIIYNTTYTLDATIQHEWIYWMRTDYLPAVIETGLPVGSRLLRLLTDVGQQGTILSVQLDFADAVSYEAFITGFSDLFYERMGFRFGGKLASFSTTLEEI